MLKETATMPTVTIDTTATTNLLTTDINLLKQARNLLKQARLTTDISTLDTPESIEQIKHECLFLFGVDPVEVSLTPSAPLTAGPSPKRREHRDSLDTAAISYFVHRARAMGIKFSKIGDILHLHPHAYFYKYGPGFWNRYVVRPVEDAPYYDQILGNYAPFPTNFPLPTTETVVAGNKAPRPFTYLIHEGDGPVVHVEQGMGSDGSLHTGSVGPYADPSRGYHNL